ncbi:MULTISPECIES: glycosyltransferase family 4 protein [Acidianus]|uniref:Glycosyl transferase n=1 Tax=Candidatus Acidianus copahuensis TaxID=1160895 RepID=A0A031LNU0_9CREN|nr:MULTISPECIES: glycosyltransferase family 4 protein [Acidianus]EZQ06752.1 glycosyl transferase [Candidatus Acidianus copahuensis]NON63265.1 glycosyltransferase family 4 protein [Acidianus sp. RZ1]
MRIAINTQTPPVRLKLTYKDILEKYGYISLPLDLNELSQDDYYISVGGVSKMMLSLLSNFKERSRWVALGPGYPPEIVMNNMNVSFIDLSPEVLSLYTKFKEGIYNEAHGVSRYEINGREYIAYATYNWLSAQKLLEYYSDTDVFFINDFQQLLIGGIIGPSAPAVLWYHIPFVPENMGERLREFVARSFEGFDLVILSTKRDMEGLLRTGAKVKAKQIYPFIDPSSYKKVSDSDVRSIESKYGIKEDDKVILVVARMDPIKSQDVAIKAIKNLNVKLVLAGDGSFTSKTLGHDKASNWVRKLKDIAKQFNVEDKVIFTGYVTDDDLFSLYQRSNVVVLPSNVEGFGLTVCEGWNYGKPVVVSKGAGASELIIEGINGYTFNPGDYNGLASAIRDSLKDEERIGQRGLETLRKCSVDYAYDQIKDVLEEAMGSYGKS